MEKCKKIISMLVVLAIFVAFIAVVTNIVLSKVDNKANPIVTMQIEGYGQVKIELYPDMAPNTVKNFIKLAQRGYYNGKNFNSVQENLITGGGDKKSAANISDLRDLAEGETDKTYAIKGEFMQSGYEKNNLSHQRGVISMNRVNASDYKDEITAIRALGYDSYLDSLIEEMYDSQSATFFIITKDDSDYNGIYSAFGKVIEGMEVIDAISALEGEKTQEEDGTSTTKITKQPVISSVSVETFGVDYGMPETIDMEDFDAIMSVFTQTVNNQQEVEQ